MVGKKSLHVISPACVANKLVDTQQVIKSYLKVERLWYIDSMYMYLVMCYSSLSFLTITMYKKLKILVDMDVAILISDGVIKKFLLSLYKDTIGIEEN